MTTFLLPENEFFKKETDPAYWDFPLLPYREVYEYKCPHCRCVNIRNQETRRLICSSCGKVFYA